MSQAARVRRRLVVGAALALALLMQAGAVACGRGSGVGDGGGGATGVVTGAIVYSGGPPPAVEASGSAGEPVAVAGTVVVRRGGGEVARQRLGDGERFRFVLAAGAYRLEARSGDALCEPSAVTVAVGEERDVRVVCQVK
ncbi:hypothetical protein [Dactylosporangium sp. NPDC051484]|uniref:hypothetical protein n=1 Tax=Dactylosporangium sp. NPDC051484 TaxID=3154942 RepID=UPI00345053D9